MRIHNREQLLAQLSLLRTKGEASEVAREGQHVVGAVVEGIEGEGTCACTFCRCKATSPLETSNRCSHVSLRN
jgi:hypothetical protein